MLNLVAVSGGFATVHPNNKLTVNVIEAAPLDAFSAEVSLHKFGTILLLTSSLAVPIFTGCPLQLAGGFEGCKRKRLGGGQAGGAD